jgi:hypothetical protein
MTWAGLAAWAVAVFCIVRILQAARRADDRMAELLAARKQAGEVIERALLEPWPGVERLTQVREEFPELPEPLVYSVACARARLARGHLA